MAPLLLENLHADVMADCSNPFSESRLGNAVGQFETKKTNRHLEPWRREKSEAAIPELKLIVQIKLQ